jgi:hypothetical protein
VSLTLINFTLTLTVHVSTRLRSPTPPPLPRGITPAFGAGVPRFDPEDGVAILAGVTPLTTGKSTVMGAGEWLRLKGDYDCVC